MRVLSYKLAFTIFAAIALPISVIAQVPTVCDIYTPSAFLNEANEILSDGTVVHLLSAGVDHLKNPPVFDIGSSDNGSPTGDDQLLQIILIGTNMPSGKGQFFSSLAVYPDLINPVPGELIYARIFNSNSKQNATYYGESELYTCQGLNGENFSISSLPANATIRCLQPTVTLALPDTFGIKNSQIKIDIDVLEDLTKLNVKNYDCRLVFDRSVLGNPVVKKSGTLTESWNLLTQQDKGDTLVIQDTGQSSLSNEGILVQIQFDIIGDPGDSTFVKLASLKFNQGEPQGLAQDGKVKVVPSALVSGKVQYWANETGLADVRMAWGGALTDTILTDEQGFYENQNLASGAAYVATPSKTGDIAGNVIIAYDASLAARIAVGVEEASDFQLKAADVDEDGKVVAFDAVHIARYAVGLQPLTTSHSGSWRFNPRSLYYEPLVSSQTNQNFTAFLLGDVDGNWTPPALQLAKFNADDKSRPEIWAEYKHKFTIPFYADENEEVYSFDIDVSYPQALIRFVNIDNTNLDDFQFVTNADEPGRLRIAAYSVKPFSGNGALCKIVFEMQGLHHDMGKIEVNRFIVNNGNPAISLLKVNAGINANGIPETFNLRQNYPNPFNPETQLRFDLPEESDVLLEIYNLLGQRVRVLVDEHLQAGYHTFVWEATDDSGNPVPSGMYVYRIKTRKDLQERKMVLLR